MPTEDEIRQLLIKKARRDILTTLKMVYPASFAFRDIRLTLPELEDRHLRVDLSYLVDKRLIEWVNRAANQPWERREFRLTAVGVETADRINKDPALEA